MGITVTYINGYAFSHKNMAKKLICYALEKTSPAKRTMLHKKLYGYKDFSNHGKYTYKRLGLLTKIKGKKITDAVLLVKNRQAAKKIINLLHEYQAKTFVFDVLNKIKL